MEYVSSFFSGELELFAIGTSILTIFVWPFRAAKEIGVTQSLSGTLECTVKGTKILTISVCP